MRCLSLFQDASWKETLQAYLQLDKFVSGNKLIFANEMECLQWHCILRDFYNLNRTLTFRTFYESPLMISVELVVVYFLQVVVVLCCNAIELAVKVNVNIVIRSTNS